MTADTSFRDMRMRSEIKAVGTKPLYKCSARSVPDRIEQENLTVEFLFLIKERR